jgi:hypothetical protein
MIVTPDGFFWERQLDRALAERLGAAPAELVDYVALVNQATGNPALPCAAVVPDDFLDDVRSAIAGMPRVVRQMLQDELLGVYFARGLGSSAITDVVVRDTGEVIGSVVALDVDAFHDRTANAWATWKENTPFAATGLMTLQAHIAEPDDDTRANALQYLLLHEFGHVLTAGRGFMPDWWSDPSAMAAADAYPFLRLAWDIDEDKRIAPRPGEDFPLRNYVAYYTGAQLTGDEMLVAYAGLESTSFPTLYAATNVYDDFAESFAGYVHTVLMKRPARIQICCDGIVIMEPADYWSEPRSAAKKAFMESFLLARWAPVPALSGARAPALHEML